jgi:hypothetical protein
MNEAGAAVISLVPPPPARTQNVSARERCRYCLDTGYVVVQTRTAVWRKTSGEFEEVGPCPMCERGFGEEFPDYSRCTKTPPVRSPWGEGGFWKGRSPVELQPLESEDARPVPRDVVLGYLEHFTGPRTPS